LTDLGHLARARGDLVAARTAYAESVAIRRSFGPLPTAQSLGWVASVDIAAGELGAARERLEEAVALLRGSSHEAGRARGFLAWATTHLGAVLLAQGDVARAGALLAESLTGTHPRGHQRVALALAALGGAAAAEAQHERALRLGGAAAALRAAAGERLERRLDFLPPATLDRWLDPARHALSQERAGAVWAEGAAMTMEEAIAYALEDAPDARPQAPPAS
jgi:hypothetical protein